MPDRLFFGDVELGEVTRENGDFPNCFGRFRPSLKQDMPAIREEIQRYIDYSIEADRLAQHDPTECDCFTATNEHKFLQLIDSDDWYLVDEQGKRSRILVPNFGTEGIGWRWHPRD